MIENGNADLTEYDFDEVRPFELNGEWIVYDDVYFDTEEIDSEQSLPHENIQYLIN